MTIRFASTSIINLHSLLWAADVKVEALSDRCRLCVLGVKVVDDLSEGELPGFSRLTSDLSVLNQSLVLSHSITLKCLNQTGRMLISFLHSTV